LKQLCIFGCKNSTKGEIDITTLQEQTLAAKKEF